MRKEESNSSWPSDVEADLGGLPDTVDRHCTDLPWLLFFFVCFGVWVYAMQWAVKCGSFERLGAFEDRNGTRCSRDMWGENQRYLYFCRNRTTAELDLSSPICIPFCPDSPFTAQEACGGLPDYPTFDMFGMVCFPDITQVLVSPTQASDLAAFQHAAQTAVAARIIVERYKALAACMIMSIVASYIEIYILEYNASCLVKFGMITMSSGCLLAAAYLLGCFSGLGFVPAPSPYLLPGGITLTVVGSVFGCVLVNLRDSVEAACDCIEMACTCVMHTPMLTLLPLGVTLWNLVLSTLSWGGVTLMLSCGRENLSGGIISVRFSAPQSICFFLQVVVGIWMHQIVFGMCQFTIAYSTALWYFEEEPGGPGQTSPKCAVWRALWHGHRYHFGTIIFGGAVVFLSRLLRLPLSLLVSWTKMHNPLGRIFSICCCCIDCLYSKTHPLSKNAFIDVAMNARPFVQAAKSADAVLMREADTIRILNGATWVFQFVGVTANAAFGACLMIWYSQCVVGDDSDVTLVMAVAGATVSGATAFPFALIFDTVSDTILYCSEVEKLRHPPPPKASPPPARGVVSRYCHCLYKASQASLGGMLKGNRRGKNGRTQYQGFDGDGDSAALSATSSPRHVTRSWTPRTVPASAEPSSAGRSGGRSAICGDDSGGTSSGDEEDGGLDLRSPLRADRGGRGSRETERQR
mmetsp:Transcript_37230/g.105871  ORF Transcript_37230/g.105871 Transcript_37230/m.105871 type:complete len:692 (+) Transcript_37230:285-2360(+)